MRLEKTKNSFITEVDELFKQINAKRFYSGKQFSEETKIDILKTSLSSLEKEEGKTNKIACMFPDLEKELSQ